MGARARRCYESDQILHDQGRPCGRWHLRPDRALPSIWNLAKYDNKEGEANPQRMNLAGDSWDARSVVMDSALGLLGAAPHDKDAFLAHVQWITAYAKRTPRPAFPKEFPLDQAKATAGKAIFDRQCASCHAEDSLKIGRPLPLADVGTNRDRLDTWGKQYAVKANKVVSDMGIERRGLVEQDLIGYNVPHLDGIWLRAPYLHNGSVPTLRDLLRRAAERPKTFYRGYDVYDPVDVGLVSPSSQRVGTLHDTSSKGNGNEGHEFGTSLSDDEKLVDRILEDVVARRLLVVRAACRQSRNNQPTLSLGLCAGVAHAVHFESLRIEQRDDATGITQLGPSGRTTRHSQQYRCRLVVAGSGSSPTRAPES